MFTNNRSKMHFKTGTKQGEEYVKLHTNGHPEMTLYQGSRATFRQQTGIVLHDKRGTMRLSESQMKKLNDFLNKQ